MLVPRVFRKISVFVLPVVIYEGCAQLSRLLGYLGIFFFCFVFFFFAFIQIF